MKGFIESVCKTDEQVYTKMGACSMFEGTPLGFIFHDKNEAFSLNGDTFNSEIKSGIIALNTKRVTPLFGAITDYQVTGGDVRTSQEGFGPEVPTGLNAKRVDYIIDKGGLCLLMQLKKLNGREVRIFQVDMSNRAFGTVATLDGVDKFRGFLATVWVTKRDNTGSQNGAIILSVFFSAKYESEENNLASLVLSEEYEGLTGVVLQKTATGKAKFVIACSKDDLTSKYGSDLNDETLYVDSAGQNPSAVAYSSSTSELTFTPTGSYKIADATVLNSAGIEGYEGENTYTNLASA
ncbi:MAG: hypothetical protein LBG96_16745 [Tannerella sp.]|jgi:hypothetical protein|nr:hypothetical protein [Tannerella sp.]